VALLDVPGRDNVAHLRQWPVLTALAEHIATDPAFAAGVLVGSFAHGRADALSDIDLLLFAPDGGFDAAWERREALRVTGALIAWDERREPEREIGKHQWVTPDLVYVECLIATPASGCRLAQPYVVIAGTLPPDVTRRPPVSRSELTGGLHPVEQAYDLLKFAIRNAGVASTSRLADDPRFLQRVEQASRSLRESHGVQSDNIDL
jgi:predicted nucleotidyltransferase